MPTWGGMIREIELAAQSSQTALDDVRRRYLVQLHQKTGRAVILYGTKWTIAGANVPADMLAIVDGDIQGFMEVMNGVGQAELDLIVHSPGGGIDAAAAIVSYLRSKFTHIRAIVPNLAMSAAGMIACAADRIVMGKHSFIGPADPQFTLPTTLGGHRQVAVQSIVEQFERAKRECIEDPRNLAVWAPLLGQYGPELLVQAERASQLSRSLVQQWLRDYMFRDDGARDLKSTEAATWLSSHENFNSHGRHITRDELRAKHLIVDNLEDDEDLQEIVLSIFHAMSHTMLASPAVKIIENHLGKAFINFANVGLQQAALRGGPGGFKVFLQGPLQASQMEEAPTLPTTPPIQP